MFARLTAIVIASLALIGQAVGASDRYTVFVSDLHVGAGREASGQWKRIEDFRWQPSFDAFLANVDDKSNSNADLVLLGDVFELWQSPFMVCSRDPAKAGCSVPDCNEIDTESGCAEHEAIARLEYVLDQHPDFL